MAAAGIYLANAKLSPDATACQIKHKFFSPYQGERDALKQAFDKKNCGAPLEMGAWQQFAKTELQKKNCLEDVSFQNELPRLLTIDPININQNKPMKNKKKKLYQQPTYGR